jgi:hypothetical protein
MAVPREPHSCSAPAPSSRPQSRVEPLAPRGPGCARRVAMPHVSSQRPGCRCTPDSLRLPAARKAQGLSHNAGDGAAMA